MYADTFGKAVQALCVSAEDACVQIAEDGCAHQRPRVGHAEQILGAVAGVPGQQPTIQQQRHVRLRHCILLPCRHRRQWRQPLRWSAPAG